MGRGRKIVLPIKTKKKRKTIPFHEVLKRMSIVNLAHFINERRVCEAKHLPFIITGFDITQTNDDIVIVLDINVSAYGLVEGAKMRRTVEQLYCDLTGKNLPSHEFELYNISKNDFREAQAIIHGTT